MRRNGFLLGLAAVAAVLSAPAWALADAPDLSGVWSGSAICKLMAADGTKTTQQIALPEVRISGGGGGLIVEIDDDTPGPTGPNGGGLCGVVAGTAEKGVATIGIAGFTASLVYDQDLFVYSLHFKSVKLDPLTGAGKMTGSGAVIPYAALAVGTCKVKLERSSDGAPAVDSDLAIACGF